jgi:hypothetical protein
MTKRNTDKKKVESKDKKKGAYYMDVNSITLPDKMQKCFVIELINKTDDKLYNVDLINFNHKEQTKIEYKGLLNEYDFVLRQLASLRKSDGLMATRIHIMANCDYITFANRQVNGDLKTIHSGLCGIVYTRTFKRSEHIDLEQYHQNILEITFEQPISLTNQLSFELEYLMPETRIRVTIFYEESLEK